MRAKANLVLAKSFRFERPRVRERQEARRISRFDIPRKDGAARRNRYRPRACIGEQSELASAHRSATTLGNVFDVFWNARATAPRRIGVTEDDDKLISTHTEDVIAAANRRTKRGDRLTQNLVACGMPVKVVVLLEVVDIEVHQADRSSLGACAREDRRQHRRECTSIERTRQFVNRCEAVEFAVVLFVIKPLGKPTRPRVEPSALDRARKQTAVHQLPAANERFINALALAGDQVLFARPSGRSESNIFGLQCVAEQYKRDILNLLGILDGAKEGTIFEMNDLGDLFRTEIRFGL
jgi:hypothetical protein